MLFSFPLVDRMKHLFSFKGKNRLALLEHPHFWICLFQKIKNNKFLSTSFQSLFPLRVNKTKFSSWWVLLQLCERTTKRKKSIYLFSITLCRASGRTNVTSERPSEKKRSIILNNFLAMAVGCTKTPFQLENPALV